METCPYCAEEIDIAVTVCPYCQANVGTPSNDFTAFSQQPQPGNTTEWSFPARAALACGFLFVAIVIALLLRAVIAPRSLAHRSVSRSNLKQIGLALHNYHDGHYVFPPGGVFDAEGAGHHSWQTSLLPYIDHAALYNRIDFNVPWNAPVNAPYFQYELSVYLNPSLGERRNSNGYSLSHYAGNSRLLNVNTSTSIREITDDTAYTILAGEVSNGLEPWGFPANYRDPAQGVGGGPGAFGRPKIGAQFLMADGSVRLIDERIHPEVLKALGTPDGGEPFDDF